MLINKDLIKGSILNMKSQIFDIQNMELLRLLNNYFLRINHLEIKSNMIEKIDRKSFLKILRNEFQLKKLIIYTNNFDEIEFSELSGIYSLILS